MSGYKPKSFADSSNHQAVKPADNAQASPQHQRPAHPSVAFGTRTPAADSGSFLQQMRPQTQTPESKPVTRAVQLGAQSRGSPASRGNNGVNRQSRQSAGKQSLGRNPINRRTYQNTAYAAKAEFADMYQV